MSLHYDITELLSYPEFYKMTFGKRGPGKTFQATLKGVTKFLKKGQQFMYVRRYKTEHENIEQFFDNIITVNNKRIAEGKAPLFPPDTKFAVIGSKRKGCGKFLINDKVAGFWVTLSVSATYKSTPYPNVCMVVFDEFLIKKGTYHYLATEVTDFEDLLETVFRDRDGPEIVGAVMLSNLVSWYNPYFTAWGITPFNTRFYRNKERSIVCEIWDSAEFNEMKYKTRRGQHLKGTRYGKYAIENEALVENSSFIEKLSKNAKPYFNIKYNGCTYGIWIDTNENKLYFSNKYDKYTRITFALTTSDHCLNTYYIKNKKSCQLIYIQSYYEMGRLYATDSMSDSALQDILKFLI